MHEEGYFDFETKNELPEELDFNKAKNCPHCKKPIPHDATMCLYCGESTHSGLRPQWITWVAIAVLISFLLLYLF